MTRCGLSASRISLLALNIGTRFAGTGTLWPVRGLRPTRERRSLAENTPKPLISTRLPLASASAMVSRMASTAISAWR